MSITRNVIRLSLSEQFKLAELIKRDYGQRRESDTGFAKYAEAELGFSLNDNHVSAVRNALNIPSTKTLIQTQKPETIAERLEACEKAIGNLIRRVDAMETFSKSMGG